MIPAAKILMPDARFEQVGAAVIRQDCTLVFDLSLPLLAQLSAADDRFWTFPLSLLADGLNRPAKCNGTAVEPALTEAQFVVVSVPEFAVYLPMFQVERYLRLAAEAVAAVELADTDLDAEWARLDGAS